MRIRVVALLVVAVWVAAGAWFLACSRSTSRSSPVDQDAAIVEIGIPPGCIPTIPWGSTTTSDRRVILADGGSYPLPEVCPFLRGRSAPRAAHNVGSTTQGVWGWNFQAVEPYDAKYNSYDAANSIVTTGKYAWFTQVVASWTVSAFPPTAGSTWNSFIGFQTDNASNGLGHGLNVLQPQVIGNSSTGWSIQLVFCCDEFSAGVTLGPALPGDTITVEIKLDERFPATLADPSLGRNWVLGANDTGNAGPVDANFGFHYTSIFVPSLEGPVDEVTWAGETVTGASAVGQYAGGAGTTSLATIHSLYQYNPADGGNLPVVPNFNPCRTFSFGAAGITRDCAGTDGASGPSTQVTWTTGGGIPIGAGGQFVVDGVNQPPTTIVWNPLNNCGGGTTGVNCDGGMAARNASDGVKADWWLNW